uniref:non-specific serine/threonine protein kinase n=1 Tax=Meloidogyne enterolobii TaxID=390850 RepID=A0A6V7WZ35_MELEN|nr:unnamed protein product [Meloidogyne enterolobii]
MTGSISSNKSSSSTSTNLVLDNEIEIKKTPMKGQENNNNIEQITQSLVQRLQPNEQGKRIRLYRNGDRFFKGIWYTIIPSLRSWPAFLEDLQKIHFLIDSLALPHGVRFVFRSNGGEPCNGLEELRHGQSYVVSSTDKFKQIDYANAAQPIWSFVSNKLTNEPTASGLRETFQREPNEFVKPRIITIIRNGIKPRRVVRHLLNKRTAQSFDMVISDITSKIKLNSGAVRKLYSISGKQVNTLADFFCDDFIFIAYGTERICCDDFNVVSEEYKRMEIGGRTPMNRHQHQQAKFRLRPTQMRMLRKRNPNDFRLKTGGDGRHMFKEGNDNEQVQLENSAANVVLPSDLAERCHIISLLGDGNTAFVYKVAFLVETSNLNLNNDDCQQQQQEEWSTEALKIIRRSTLENPEVLALVQTEIELLKMLKHENIVQLYDCIAHPNGDWFIRMECVPDGDLFELLRKRRMFSETEVASCADCLCRALAYLHTEHLIVHRDVKLENLLVYYIPDNLSGQRLMIKLADFGLACQLESADQLLILLCGTPTYVAPEVLAEFGYSFKADCWSVGIILYCLLCGYPPFGVDEPDDVLFNRILRGQFHFPSPVFDSISNSAKLLITRLLNTDPFMRASATDVVEWHWTKGLANVSQENELEAEEQLAIAIAGMLMLDDDDDDEQQKQYSDDFAMSESSAEFFFSRRASMDELLCEDDNDDEEEGGGEQGKMLLFSSIATTIATNVFSSSAIATASFSATTNSISNPPNAPISTDVTKLIRSDSPYEFPPIQLPPISQSLLATAMPSLLPSSNTDLHLLEQQQQQQTSSSLASLATDKRKRQRGDSIKKHQNIKIDFQQPQQKLQQNNEKEASSLASVDKIISSCVGGINKEATQQTTPRMQRKIILQPQQSTTGIRRKQNLRHISLDDNGVVDDNNEIGRIAVTNVNNNNNTPTTAAATRTTTTTAASTGRRQRRTATIR